MIGTHREDPKSVQQSHIRLSLRSARRENVGLVVTLYILFIFALFPGRFDSDSVAQYFQGVTFNFHDWLSPIMSLLLGIMRPMTAGPAPMFVVQLTLFFVGVLLLSDSLVLVGRKHLGQATSVVMAMPIVSFNFLDVQKDALCCALTVLAIGLFARSIVAPRSMSIVKLIGILCVLTIMLDARKNSLFILIPICFGFAYFVCRVQSSVIKAGAVAGLLLASSFAVQQAVVYGALQTRKTHALVSLIVYDIAGITSRIDKDASSGLVGTDFIADVRRCYTANRWDNFAPWGLCKERGLLLQQKFETDEGQSIAIRVWLKAIAQHPLAYLSHRWAVFAALMRISCEDCREPMNPGVRYERPYSVWQPDIQIDYSEPQRITVLGLMLERLAMMSYFSAWSWGFCWMIIFAAGILLAVVKWQRSAFDQFDLLMAIACVAGLSYSAGFFFVSVSDSLRYLHVVYALGLVNICLMGQNVTRAMVTAALRANWMAIYGVQKAVRDTAKRAGAHFVDCERRFQAIVSKYFT